MPAEPSDSTLATLPAPSLHCLFLTVCSPSEASFRNTRGFRRALRFQSPPLSFDCRTKFQLLITWLCLVLRPCRSPPSHGNPSPRPHPPERPPWTFSTKRHALTEFINGGVLWNKISRDLCHTTPFWIMLNMLTFYENIVFINIIGQSLSSQYNLFTYFICLNRKTLPFNLESFRAFVSPIELVSLNCWCILEWWKLLNFSALVYMTRSDRAIATFTFVA